MTPGVNRLHENLVRLQSVLDKIEFDFVDDPHWSEPSDFNYLKEDHRADPDIMANFEAMNATNQFISWFGRDHEGFVGLWRGPDNTPTELAPVVRLDSEGQYNLLALTVPDYIAASVMDEDFDDTRAALLAVGFKVAASRRDIWAELDGLNDPNAVRHALYNQNRLRRGLQPI